MMLMRYVHTLYALAAVSTWHPSALRSIAPTSDADSATTVLVLQELRGYYRDLHDRNWTSIVTHFYPAKVTARFAAPDGDRAWASLPLPAIEPHESPDAHGYCMPNTAIAIVGHWARVRARRCTGEADEAWLYSMSGRWKIIHLESGASLTMSRESRQSHRPTSRAVP